MVFSRKKRIANLDAKVKLNPIGALQELCALHQWTLPQYKFFEIGRSGNLFSAECTVRACTIEGKPLI